MQYDKVMCMTYTLTVTSQGQVSIPAKVRRLWGILKRGQITLTLQGKKRAIVEPTLGILDLAGSLKKYAIKGKSIEEIMMLEKKAIEDGWVEHYLKKVKRSGNKLLVI